MKKLIVNVETGKTKEVNWTEEEIADYEAFLENEKAKAKAEADKAIAKSTAKAKLQALGLTDSDIDALLS